MKTIQTIIITLLLSSLCVNAETKWFVAPEIDKVPDIKLGLDDPVWDKGLKVSFNKLNNEPGESGVYPTESYWLFANGSLFVAFKMIHPDSPKLWSTTKQPRDNTLLFGHECVEFCLGDMAGELYYQFAMDTVGNLYDGERWDKRWDGTQTHHVQLKDGYWTITMKIPADILRTIWAPGNFVTIDLLRNSFKRDGSEEVVTAISPPGVHSPEDKMFLGTINPMVLGENLKKAIQTFKNDFKSVSINKNIEKTLERLSVSAQKFANAGNVDLRRYKDDYREYLACLRDLERMRQDALIRFMFSQKLNRAGKK